MYKNIISSILLMVVVMSMLGCKGSLEKVYSLGEHVDPDDPMSRRFASSAAKKPESPCEKELAFGYYCLGGSIKELLDQRSPLRQHAEDDLYVFDFRERRGLTTITTFQGKILSVSRSDRPANWQTAMAVRQRIERLYGKADDRSTFAADIDTPRQLEFAVYKGKAKAHYVWPMSGWRIDVVWDDIRNIDITFLDVELNRSYLASQKQPEPKYEQGLPSNKI